MNTDKSNMTESFEDYLLRHPYKDTRSFTKDDWELSMYERWSEENGFITKPEQDNSNIVSNSESLQEMAERMASTLYNKDDYSLWDTSDASAWIRRVDNIILGAEWKEEQLKPIIQSHAELLCIMKDLAYNNLSFYKLQGTVQAEIISQIEKANKLIRVDSGV